MKPRALVQDGEEESRGHPGLLNTRSRILNCLWLWVGWGEVGGTWWRELIAFPRTRIWTLLQRQGGEWRVQIRSLSRSPTASSSPQGPLPQLLGFKATSLLLSLSWLPRVSRLCGLYRSNRGQGLPAAPALCLLGEALVDCCCLVAGGRKGGAEHTGQGLSGGAWGGHAGTTLPIQHREEHL